MKLFDEFFTAKPLLAHSITVGGLVTWAVAWLMELAHVLSPLIALVAAIFGAVAGYYTMKIKRREWLAREPHKHKHAHNKTGTRPNDARLPPDYPRR